MLNSQSLDISSVERIDVAQARRNGSMRRAAADAALCRVWPALFPEGATSAKAQSLTGLSQRIGSGQILAAGSS
jgi:hypothetical protein